MSFEIIGEITDIETIAVGSNIRDVQRLQKHYGTGRWRKRKGIARIRLADERMERFATYRREERGLSPRTILARGWQVQPFLSGLSEHRRCFAQVVLEEIDE